MDDDRAGYMVAYGKTTKIYTFPEEKWTEKHISGRFS